MYTNLFEICTNELRNTFWHVMHIIHKLYILFSRFFLKMFRTEHNKVSPPWFMHETFWVFKILKYNIIFELGYKRNPSSHYLGTFQLWPTPPFCTFGKIYTLIFSFFRKRIVNIARSWDWSQMKGQVILHSMQVHIHEFLNSPSILKK